MPSTTYVARRPGPFSALVQAATLGGLRLEPLPPVRALDRFYDTDDGGLLREGLALRVREQGGQRTVGLRALQGAPALPADIDLLGGDEGRVEGRLDLPPGPLDAAVRAVVGPDVLRPLLSLRQYRTPRVAYDGATAVGVLSFDVVVYQVPGTHVVSNEIEVQPSRDDGPLLGVLDTVLRAQDLEPADHSKFERGVLRLPRTLSEAALLIPDERRVLEAAAASEDPQLRRRARVVLLDARGFRPDTIAAQTGLSMARVRHWREQFREVRLGMLEREPTPTPSRRSAAPRPAALRPAEPSTEAAPPASPPPAPPSAPPSAPHPPPHAPAEGDGVASDAATAPTEVADMAALLDLFSPPLPDTPFFDVEHDVDDHEEPEAAARPSAATPRADDAGMADAGSEAPASEQAPPPSGEPDEPDETEAPRWDPYPVVLGPVAEDLPETVTISPDAFADVDLSALRARLRSGAPALPDDALSVDAAGVEAPAAGEPAPAVAPAPDVPDAAPPDLEPTPSAPRADEPPRAEPAGALAAASPQAVSVEEPPAPPARPPSSGRTPAVRQRPVLPADTPLLVAARATVAYYVAAFEELAAQFVESRKPSDARRLLVALHRLRLTVETFGSALPAWASDRLVAVLRPLAGDLDAALDASRAALLDSPARDVLARRAAAALAAAAARLEAHRQRDWGARAARLLDLLDAQSAAGLLRPDDASPADDFVGEPGDAPTPTRLRHIAGSALWRRFEALRAVEDDLGRPTPDLAAHLAVAVSGLRFTLGLVADTDVHDVTQALDAAERELAQARQREVAARLGAADADLEATHDALADVWRELTDRPFRSELAAVVVTI